MARLKPFDFSLLNDAQLCDLEAQIKLEIARRREESKQLARHRTLVEGRGPRYRNPQNSAETWSGRGTMPSWVEQALAAGAKLEDLEITDNRPAPRDASDG